jgi:hypothetical protein
LSHARSRVGAACAAFLAVCAALAADERAVSRIEARSADLLAVGVVHGDRMSIHISRLSDNAPVHDAVLTVLLRGVTHPTVAEADGSYALQTPELAIPGTAAVVFDVVETGGKEVGLTGEISVANGVATDDKSSARQLGWWILNFAVCIGFLMLLSRRRKLRANHDEP